MHPASRLVGRPTVLALAALVFAASARADDDFSSLGNFKLPARSGAFAPGSEIKGAPVEDPALFGGGKTKEVNHLPQFADPSDRSQCQVGSCHAFSSIAVLEAAYKRAYGVHIRFSEADIFIRRTVLSGDVYRSFCAEGKCELSEGNDVYGDIDYALKNGVATSIQYTEFYDRYKKYRAAEEKTLEGIEAGRKKMSWLELLFYDPRTHWAELQKESSKITEAFLRGRDGKIDQERADAKGKLGKMALKEKRFKYLGDDGPKKKKEECRSEGADQGRTITGELDSGRPTAISMTLKGIAAWGTAGSTDHANHAFTIVGYKAEEGKPVVYRTRNSWGGDNPDVQEDELCRVYSVITVLVPGEKAAF